MSYHLSPSPKPTTWWPSISPFPTVKTSETTLPRWPTTSRAPTVSPFPSYFERKTEENDDEYEGYYYYYYYYEDDALSENPTSSPPSSWWPITSAPTVSPTPTPTNTEKSHMGRTKSSVQQTNDHLKNEKIVFKSTQHISLDEMTNNKGLSNSTPAPSAGIKKNANSISLDDVSPQPPSPSQIPSKKPTISPFPSSSGSPTISPFPSFSSTPTVSPFPSSKDTSTVSPFPSSSSTPTISPFPSSANTPPYYYYYYYYNENTNEPSTSPTISKIKPETEETTPNPQGTDIGNNEDFNFVRMCNDYVLNKHMFKTADKSVTFYFQIEHSFVDVGKLSWNHLAINLLDMVARSTLTCDQGNNPRNIRHRFNLENEENGVFAVSYPSEGFFLPLGKCDNNDVNGKQCDLIKGEMVLTTLPQAFDRAKFNMLQTIKDAMNSETLASTNPNILKTEYVGPVISKIETSETTEQRSSKLGMVLFSSAFVVSLMGSIFLVYRHRRSKSGGNFNLPKTIGSEVEFCFEDDKPHSNNDIRVTTTEAHHSKAADFSVIERVFAKQECPLPTVTKDAYSQEQTSHRERRPRQDFENIVEDTLTTKSDESEETLRMSWKTTHKDSDDSISPQHISSSSRSHFDALKRSERYYEGNKYETDSKGKYENILNRSSTPERESYRRERAKYASSRYKERYSDTARSKSTDSRRSYRSVSPRKEHKHRHSDLDSDDPSTNDFSIRPSRSYSPINSHEHKIGRDDRRKEEDMLFSSLGIQSSSRTPPRNRAPRTRKNYTSSNHRVSFNDDGNIRRGSYRALASVDTPSTVDESSDSLSPERIRRSSYRRNRLSN